MQKLNADFFSQRLKDRVDLLSSLVITKWRNIKLRIKTGWTEPGILQFDGKQGILHFEGILFISFFTYRGLYEGFIFLGPSTKH